MGKLILLSGGIDSSALAKWISPTVSLTVDYGQAAAGAELHAAQQISRALAIEHHTIRVDCTEIGGGSMSTRHGAIPSAPTPEWWPYRNQLLISIAAAWGVVRGIDTIYIGSVKSDSAHMDGSDSFLLAMDNLLKVQEGGLSVVAPALHLKTDELLRISRLPSEILGWTHSCHTGDFACGRCRGCLKHLSVLELQSPVNSATDQQ
jgi:7-cyano-7-deazaguanine synthase